VIVRGSCFCLVLALGVSACGDDRRSGGGIVIRRDAGPDQEDATSSENDTGVPVIDSGVPVPDLGVRDLGVADSGGEEADSGIVMPVELSIRALQDESNSAHPVMDTRVRLSGVIVTAVQTMGDDEGSFWVQDPLGGPYSGILIYVPPEKVGIYTVVPGESLVLNGVYKEYFDVSEVVLDTIETQTPGEEPPPTELSPGEIATGGTLGEAFEGVLVRVSSLTVVSENPDVPMDFGEFMVNGDLRIDDQLYRLTPRPPIDTSITYIIGVHHHAFANYKLLPRSALDIAF
jgi:hypothetical protein